MKFTITNILLLCLSVFGRAQRIDPGFTSQFMRDGFIERVVATPDGKAVISGNFSFIGSFAGNGLARIGTDGSPDPTFNPVSIKPLTATAIGVQADGKVLVNIMGFDENGDRNGKLIRLLTDGSPDPSFSVQEFTGKWIAHIKVLPNQRIYVAFNSLLPGRASFGVGLFESDGMPVTDFPIRDFGGGTAYIADIAVQSDDALLVFGRHLNYEGELRPTLRMDANGVVDESFQPTYFTENDIVDLKVAVTQGGEIGAINENTGEFAWLDSMGMTRYNRTLDVGDVFQVEMVAVEDEGVLIIGENLIAQYKNSRGVIHPGLGIGKFTLARSAALLPGNRVIVGGVFSSANNRLVTGLTAYVYETNSNTFAFDNQFSSGVFRPAHVRDFEVQPDGQIVAVGDFLFVNGLRKPYFAKIDSTGALDTSFPNVPPAEEGRALVSYEDGSLLVATKYSPQVSGLLHYSAEGQFLNAVSYEGSSTFGTIGDAIAISDNAALVIDGSSTTSSTSAPNGDQPIYRFQLDEGAITVERLNELYLDSIHHCKGATSNHGGQPLLYGSRIAYDGGMPAPVVRLLPNGRRDESFSSSELVDYYGFHLSINPDGVFFLGAQMLEPESGTPIHHLLLIDDEGSLVEDLTERFTAIDPVIGPQVNSLVHLGNGHTLVIASATAYDGISIPSGQFVLDAEGELVDEYLEGLNIVVAEEAIESGEDYYLAGILQDRQRAGIARIIATESSTVAYQPTATENAKWVIANSETSFFPNSHFILSAQGDTIVNGTTYKKLYREVIDFVETETSPVLIPPYELLPGKELLALLRDEKPTRRVYGIIMGSGFTEEVLLHDYSTPIGEQMVGDGFDQNYPLTVDDTEEILVFGATRLTQHANNLHFYEGVGSLEFGPLSGGSAIAVNCCLFRLIDYCVGDYSNCSIISSTNELPAGGRITTYPNPFANQLDIAVSDVAVTAPITVRLFDLSGRVLREGEIRDRLRWTGFLDLAPGMYFITYVLDGVAFTEKLIHRR